MQRIPREPTDACLHALECFLLDWLGPRKAEYGVAPESFAGHFLPDPLRRFYAFAGRWPASRPHSRGRFSNQDQLLPLAGEQDCVRIIDSRLIFAVENQWCWQIGTLPEGADPPVWLTEDPVRTDAVWCPLKSTLSQFLTGFALQECLFGAHHVACAANALPALRAAGLNVEPLWLEAESPWTFIRHSSFYLIERTILLRHDIGDDMPDDYWYAFRSDETFPLLRELGLPTKIG